MLALIAFAAAQSASPGMPGVWEGQVGTLPVRVCFANTETRSFGAYYYMSHRRLIPLEAEEGDEVAYSEGGPDANGPRWVIEGLQGNQLRARWSQGRRVLPVRLSRVTAAGDYEEACSSVDFHRPRLSAVRTVTRRATQDGTAYTAIALDHGDRFEASIETFALDGSGDAVRRINASLARPLSGDPPEWFECMRLPLDTSPWEGDLHERYAPAMIARRWLSVNHNYDASCGGAHPSSGLVYETFDMVSGAEVDLHDWFDEVAVERDRIEGSEDVLKKVRSPLRDVVLAGWTGEGECGEVVREAEYWHIGLRRNAFIFSPSLPHVAQACAEEYTVPFARVRRFLTRDGAANVDALR